MLRLPSACHALSLGELAMCRAQQQSCQDQQAGGRLKVLLSTGLSTVPAVTQHFPSKCTGYARVCPAAVKYQAISAATTVTGMACAHQGQWPIPIDHPDA